MHGIGSAKSFVHIETVFQRYERRRRGESEKFNLTVCFASSVYGMVRLVGVQFAVRQRRRTHAHARESRRRRRRIQGEDKANRNVQRNDLSRYENDLAWNEFVPYSLFLCPSLPMSAFRGITLEHARLPGQRARFCCRAERDLPRFAFQW